MRARERDSMQRPRQQFETGLTKGLPVGGGRLQHRPIGLCTDEHSPI
jgi:hypothetical protein